MNCGSMFPTFLQNTWTATPIPPESFVHDAGRAAMPQACLDENPTSVSRLVELLDENGEDDYGMIGPTQYAFKTAYRMVERAEHIVSGDLLASSSVDPEGGIRVTWRSRDRQVKLICPANTATPVYIYQSSRDGSSVRNQNVTPQALADTLSWLLGDSEPAISQPTAG